MGLDQEAPDSLHDRRVPAGIGLPTYFDSQGVAHSARQEKIRSKCDPSLWP
jgi:hypothetical protein